MRCHRSLVLAFLVAGIGSRPATAQPSSRATLYEGARLITGDGRAPIENAAFLVENSRFSRVGRKGEIQPPAGTARVDLTGKTVIPALIDGHSHIGYMRNMTSGAQNYTRENILDHMRRFAHFPELPPASAWGPISARCPSRSATTSWRASIRTRHDL